MEKKSEALYKLLSDYQTEFRTQFVLAAFLPFVAAWASLVTKTSEKKGDYADVVFVIIIASVLVVFIMIVGHLRHEKNRSLQEKARILVIRAAGHSVDIVRFYDLTPLCAFSLVEHHREHWGIRTKTADGACYYLLQESLALTVVQANAVERLLNETAQL